MPLKVVVLSDFIPEALLVAASPEVMQSVLADIASSARAFWIQKAGEKLQSSRRDYLAGIQEVELGDGMASVTLTGNMAMMVENGASPYDMHDTLLGPNVPVAAPGQRGKRVNAEGQFYRSIPFRHQTPGTIGQGGGATMGSAYAGVVENSAKLGRSIWKAAKALEATTSMPGGGTKWGGRLQAGMAPLLKAHHSTDIYAGMVRNQKTYGKATQNTYTTFRTISNSVPNKWMHPGIPAANLADEVVKHVEEIAPAAFAAALGAAL